MVEINLLPQQYRKQTAPDVWKYASAGVVGLTLLLLAGGFISTSTNINRLQGQIDGVQGDITALTPQKQEYDALTSQVQTLEKVTAVAQTLKGTKTYWSNDLASFSQQIPATSGVALKNMRMQNKSATDLGTDQNNGIYVGKQVRREMTISGTATSQQAVINLLNIFENNPNFGLNFKGMQKDTTTNDYQFDAAIGIVGDTPAASATGTAPGSTAPGTVTASTPATTGTPASTAPAPAPAPAAPVTPPAGGVQ